MKATAAYFENMELLFLERNLKTLLARNNARKEVKIFKNFTSEAFEPPPNAVNLQPVKAGFSPLCARRKSFF